MERSLRVRTLEHIDVFIVDVGRVFLFTVNGLAVLAMVANDKSKIN